MKVSARNDYPVRVIPEPEEREGPEAHFFEGIFRLVLNHTVDVVFVPGVGSLAPPWDDRRLPAAGEELESPEQARLLTALFTPYVVTPNNALAGGEMSFEMPIDGGSGIHVGVVFSVTAEEFTRYVMDLDELSEIAFARSLEKRVSDLRRFDEVTFLQRRVVASRWLRPADAAILGR